MCCEDNADALTHHELLLPGHLLCKYLKVDWPERGKWVAHRGPMHQMLINCLCYLVTLSPAPGINGVASGVRCPQHGRGCAVARSVCACGHARVLGRVRAGMLG